jgi:hypothetical protein
MIGFNDLMNKYNETGIEDIENEDLSVDGLIYKLIALDEGGHGVYIEDYKNIKLEIEHHLKRKITKSEIDKLAGDKIRIKDKDDNLIENYDD